MKKGQNRKRKKQQQQKKERKEKKRKNVSVLTGRPLAKWKDKLEESSSATDWLLAVKLIDFQTLPSTFCVWCCAMNYGGKSQLWFTIFPLKSLCPSLEHEMLTSRITIWSDTWLNCQWILLSIKAGGVQKEEENPGWRTWRTVLCWWCEWYGRDRIGRY